MENSRALWLAVVLQAIDDLETEPRYSLVYADAVAFFTHDGQWAQARRAIADMLGMHPDDLQRGGARVIARRRAADGLPPDDPRPPTPRPPAPAPAVAPAAWPRLVATYATPEPRQRGRNPAKRWHYDPAAGWTVRRQAVDA